MIRVYVVDDHPVVVQGTGIVLSGSDEMALVGSAATAVDAIRGIASLSPDVILLDVRLEETEPAALVSRISAVSPSSSVILFTADPRHFAVPAAMVAGAVAVISKDVRPQELRRAIVQAANGERVEAGREGSDHQSIPSLTPRELEVLRHVALGSTNAEIAADLGLAVTTVKTYWQSAMQKLGSRNRIEAVGVAHDFGLLRLPR